MNVTVVGRGAVGTYVGGLLESVGARTTYVPRELAAVEPVATDLAIVAVKSFDTGGAVVSLERALARSPDAAILCVQNGVGNEEILAAAFGADRVVAAALTVPVERLAGGRVAEARAGGLGLAPCGSASQNWIVAAFERTDVPVRVYGDWRAMKWSKLALNVVANAQCAILDVLPGELVRVPGAFARELAALRECFAVIAAQGLALVDLPRYPVRALAAAVRLPDAAARVLLARRIAGARGAKPPSLLLDLRAGRLRTEARALGGAIAAAGDRLGVAAPVNATFALLVDEIARDPAQWKRYRGRPAELERAIRGT